MSSHEYCSRLYTAPKKDLPASSAEMAYCALFSIPHFNPPSPQTSVLDVLHRLREQAGGQTPSCHRPDTAHHPIMFQQICSSPTTFSYAEASKELPLQCLYEVPFKVLWRDGMVFTLDIGDRQDRFTVGRLNFTHLDSNLPTPNPQVKHRGRPLKDCKSDCSESGGDSWGGGRWRSGPSNCATKQAESQQHKAGPRWGGLPRGSPPLQRGSLPAGE
ncbi:uncharacterized protein [Narcine bancroftii]|uniref:uncharacterized protein n=1 Tax=Narcine bancroftii TaxID=1343680 RepID=UPI003831ACF7